MKDIQQQFIDHVTKIVYGILKNENLLKSEWHLGKVDRVISNTKISAFVDGSNVSQIIPCNPDVTFNSGDEIFIIFLNNDSRNKYAISKRGI
jgi:hypothetical protein